MSRFGKAELFGLAVIMACLAFLGYAWFSTEASIYRLQHRCFFANGEWLSVDPDANRWFCRYANFR